MAQIAQQDNLIILSTTAIAALETATKTKLIGCIIAGTIGDVILVTTEATGKVNSGKVIAHMVDSSTPATPKYKILVADANAGAVTEVALN